jgi:transketolase
MCEIPSNVILAEEFAEIFDGFSIGSNDLTQLMLGVDRDSEICGELFDEQPTAYRDQVLLPSVPLRLACEAGIRLGWDTYIGLDGIFVGMTGFGASAPADQLYKHFKITAEQIVLHIKTALA